MHLVGHRTFPTFNDLETLKRVTQAITEDGERTEIEDEEDNYE